MVTRFMKNMQSHLTDYWNPLIWIETRQQIIVLTSQSTLKTSQKFCFSFVSYILWRDAVLLYLCYGIFGLYKYAYSVLLNSIPGHIDLKKLEEGLTKYAQVTNNFIFCGVMESQQTCRCGLSYEGVRRVNKEGSEWAKGLLLKVFYI